MERLVDNQNVNWRDLYIKVYYDLEFFAEQPRNSFQGNLMALSCARGGEIGDTTGLKAIYIKTLTDYNTRYKAGDTINQLVNILTNYPSQYIEPRFTTVSNYVDENQDRIRDQFFTFTLIESPASNAEYSFELIYQLNDGTTFQHITTPVQIIR